MTINLPRLRGCRQVGNRLKVLGLMLLLAISGSVVAATDCKPLFTNPSTQRVLILPPPGLDYSRDLTCSSGTVGGNCSTTRTGTSTPTGSISNKFAPGDYAFYAGKIENGAVIASTGATVRLYFYDLDLNNVNINVNGSAQNVLIYVKHSLAINGNSKVNAIIYVGQSLTVSGNPTLNGALAAGSTVTISGNAKVNFGQGAVDSADFTGLSCDPTQSFDKIIDHFEFHHSGSGLTCNPESITLRACWDPLCQNVVTDPVVANLTTISNGGWSLDGANFSNNPVTFSPGGTLFLANRSPGPVQLAVLSSTPAIQPINNVLCASGGGALGAGNCSLNFADSGFIFDVKDTLANQSQQVQIKAVKKDDATKQCVPGFASVSKPVSLWSDYVSPNSNSFGSQIKVNGTAIAATQAAAQASPRTLNFDANGTSTLTVNYPDAGQMRLNARHDGSGDSTGLVMTGSDLFISRPIGLCITAQKSATEQVVGCNPVGANADCPMLAKAGEPFQLAITARAWEQDNDADFCTGNLVTPNFALANIALDTKLVAPKPGVAATVRVASYEHGKSVVENGVQTQTSENGIQTIKNQSVNEVGVFQMTATPPIATSPTTGYFGYTIPLATSVQAWRFVPWDFNLVSGNISPACGAFSYMGQPFGVQMKVQARNKVGSVTKNYVGSVDTVGSFGKGALYLVADNGKDGVNRSARLGGLDSRWLAGEATIDGQTRFARLTGLSAPEESLPALEIGLKVADNDGGITVLSGGNMNAAKQGDCGTGCDAVLLGRQSLRYGRLLASTGQGVASAPLALPLQTQYYEQGQWQLNADDSCTSLSLTGKGILFTDSNQHENMTTWDSLLLGGGVPIHLGLGNAAPGETTATITKGVTQFQFSAPNIAVRIPYRIVLEQEPSAPLWLLDPTTPSHLNGEAIFGSHRGNDRIITRREVIR